MTPKTFKEQNKVYVAEGCGNLPVYEGNGAIISCWKMDSKDKLAALFFGETWLLVVGGIQPPVCVSVFPPFENEIGQAYDFNEMLQAFAKRQIDQFLTEYSKGLDESAVKIFQSEKTKMFLEHFFLHIMGK